MTTIENSASFVPAAEDAKSLSRSHRLTLDALFQHPMAHGLEWTDVVSLVGKIGEIENHANGETCFVVAGERKLFRKPHTKDIPPTMLMDVRHMLTRAGWSPHAARSSKPIEGAMPPSKDVLVVVEQVEARVYRLDAAAAEESDQVIRSDLSTHRRHELAHKDQDHDGNVGWKADPGYYERIAQALHGRGAIVPAGHGHGHGNAVHNLEHYLQQRHATIASRLCPELEVDLSSLTDEQRRALGRKALAEPEPGANAWSLVSAGRPFRPAQPGSLEDRS